MTRVLVAASSPTVRRGLESLLRSSPGVTVVGSTSSDTDTISQQIEELQPDVVLLEAGRQDDDSSPVLPALSAGEAAPALVVLTDRAARSWAAEAIRAGVRALLPREATAEEIVAAVEAAAAGLVVVQADVVDYLLPSTSASRTLPASPAQALSPREIEVLGMLAEGLGNKQIAARLGISEHTVKFHVSSIFTKLDVSSRTEAVTLGYRLGLIML